MPSTAMLISMLHSWPLGTDGNGATVGTLLLDYRKAIDLIGHSILVESCVTSVNYQIALSTGL